jgi:DNA-binding CsgD family transcriptional regulator
MTSISENDHEQILDGLGELYALGSLETFPARVLRVVHGVVGCDEASFNEIDLVSGSYRVLVDPEEGAHDAAAPQFGHYMHEHPVLAYVAETGDPRPHTVSDFLRPVEFRRLGLYGEFFGPLGIEDQLSTSLLVTPGERVIAVALDRGGTFSERDHAVLDALRPHLLRAYRNAVVYGEALSRRGADDELAAAARAALAVLSARQLEVLSLLAAGRSNAQRAAELGIRPATAKKHIEHILARLGVGTRLAAARIYLLGSAPPAQERWWILNGRAEHTLAGESR